MESCQTPYQVDSLTVLPLGVEGDIASSAGDTPALQQADLDYFDRGRRENPRFWARLGGQPDLRDAVVVDIGCGHGSLCVDMARSGARRVIGLDLDAHRINFANENLRRNYPDLLGVVEFRVQDLCELPESQIDAFVSKDTFEHVIGLGQLLEEVCACLKVGGRVYAGIGPLWNSPFGDHGRTRALLPWGHVILPQRLLLRWRNWLQGEKADSLADLGLNGLSLADYLRLFESSGMTMDYLRVNASNHPASRLFSLVGRIPLLREYVSHNLYCILRK